VDEAFYKEQIARLQRDKEELRAEIERLRKLLEEAQRSAKRQAAPFSRHHPKAYPASPGRKKGKRYGQHCRRPIPPQIDEVVEVPLPEQCPQCGGLIESTGVVSQYQTEIPEPRVQRTEFRIQLGCCQSCGRKLQGRHERQTSRAIGSAASQLGPRALALATVLNKGLGLPYGKTATVLEQGWGLQVSRGGLCQALQRVGRKAAPTYESLRQQIRSEPRVTGDETGWKVAAQLWWMWVFTSSQTTVYSIEAGRGFPQAAAILGPKFKGVLVHDGWRIYGDFRRARHQTCLAHLLRRCREMMLVASPPAARFPQAVAAVLQASLQVRERRDQEQISSRGLRIARGQMEARLDRLLQQRPRSPANRRLANHLRRERDAVFTFLYRRGVDATNWRAEQAIRPMVVTRKVWGGNRTQTGAHTQSIVLSFLQTCRQRHLSAVPLLQQLLCSPQPTVLTLTAPPSR
jgi:transposase